MKKKITIKNCKRNLSGFSLHIDFPDAEYNCFIDHDRTNGITSHVNFNPGCIKEIKTIDWNVVDKFRFRFEKLDQEDVLFQIDDNNLVVTYWYKGERPSVERSLNNLFTLELEVEK